MRLFPLVLTMLIGPLACTLDDTSDKIEEGDISESSENAIGEDDTDTSDTTDTSVEETDTGTSRTRSCRESVLSLVVGSCRYE